MWVIVDLSKCSCTPICLHSCIHCGIYICNDCILWHRYGRMLPVGVALMNSWSNNCCFKMFYWIFKTTLIIANHWEIEITKVCSVCSALAHYRSRDSPPSMQCDSQHRREYMWHCIAGPRPSAHGTTIWDSLDSSPLNSGPGIYCWRVGGQLIYYLPYFISLNVKTVLLW